MCYGFNVRSHTRTHNHLMIIQWTLFKSSSWFEAIMMKMMMMLILTKANHDRHHFAWFLSGQVNHESLRREAKKDLDSLHSEPKITDIIIIIFMMMMMAQAVPMNPDQRNVSVYIHNYDELVQANVGKRLMQYHHNHGVLFETRFAACDSPSPSQISPSPAQVP